MHEGRRPPMSRTGEVYKRITFGWHPSGSCVASGEQPKEQQIYFNSNGENEW